MDGVEASAVVFNSSFSMSAVRFGVIVLFLVVPESGLQDKHRKKPKRMLTTPFRFFS